MESLNFNFRFAGIQIISKSMAEPPIENIENSIFNFNIKIEIRVKAENKIVIPFVDVLINEASKKYELAKIKMAFLFEIEDFENVIKLNDQNIHIVPQNFENIIKPVAISTARGIIYSEFRGTYLQGAIMPVIFMNTLVEETINEIQE